MTPETKPHNPGSTGARDKARLDGRFVKTDKTRLPRREKKALQTKNAKAAARK